MKLRHAFAATAAFMLAAMTLAQDSAPKALMVGDPAPGMMVSKWVKGSPVKKFEKGNIYVVEFWATWCGPCKVSIPHLTELAKKHKDVKFVGVSIWESDQKLVEPFVKEMGSKMDYIVAMDQLPGGVTDGSQGAMAKSWMQASGQNGIPSAFIVDKEGKVAWIGHPMEMEEPLEKVVAGTWNTASFAEKVKEDQIINQRLTAFGGRIAEARKANDDAGILKVYGEMLQDPSQQIKTAGAMSKFSFLLMKVKDYDAAYAHAKEAIAGPLKDEPEALNGMAWDIVDPESKIEKRDLDVALMAASRSVELKKGPENLDTLAWTYFHKGDKAKAIELEKEAISLATGDLKADLEKSLKIFEG